MSVGLIVLMCFAGFGVLIIGHGADKISGSMFWGGAFILGILIYFLMSGHGISLS